MCSGIMASAGGTHMQIEKNKVVTFHYRVSEAGLVGEDSHDAAPAVYLHGHLGVLIGLEEAMTGKQPGDIFSITLPAEKAYGPRQPNAVQRVSLKHVLTRGSKKVILKPGMVVQVNTNHALAGKSLSFDIEVVDVRDATPDELAHGHAHGDGGHQH